MFPTARLAVLQSIFFNIMFLVLLCDGWDKDKQNCLIHRCPARKTVAKVEEWSKLKHGLYGKKSKNYLRWLCTESLYQLGESEPLEPAAKRKGISINSPSMKRKSHMRTVNNLEHSGGHLEPS